MVFPHAVSVQAEHHSCHTLSVEWKFFPPSVITEVEMGTQLNVYGSEAQK